MTVWFEGSGTIECTLEEVEKALENYPEHLVEMLGQMPGLTDVELVDQGNNAVIIRANEGLMKRSNITTQVEDQRVVVEFDEQYQTGAQITNPSHFVDEFTPSGNGVTHRMVISGVKKPGSLGFFYQKFGSDNIGSGFLQAYKAYFEEG